MTLRAILAGLAMTGAFCASLTPSIAQPLQVVSFNVGNLFDTDDDADNPHDNSYLPLAVKQQNAAAHKALCESLDLSPNYLSQCINLDWSDEVYEAKLGRIAEVLLAMGASPDIVVLPETENLKVLDDLANGPLQSEGYVSVVQLDTSDEPKSRGIDVGMISKLPLVGDPVAHRIDFGSFSSRCRPTRDIVEATFELPDGENLHLFGVHFPAQSNPKECRYAAMLKLNSLRAALGDTAIAIAAGDFNFACDETVSPAYSKLLADGRWRYSPVIASSCFAPGSSSFFDSQLKRGTWSYLDQILISIPLSQGDRSASNWFADLGSFQTVVVSQEQVEASADGFISPHEFDPVTKHGVSDHWPVMMRLLNRKVTGVPANTQLPRDFE